MLSWGAIATMVVYCSGGRLRQELAQNLAEFLAQVLVEFMELQDYLLAQRLVEEVPVQAEDEGTAEPLPQALGGKGRGPGQAEAEAEDLHLD